MLRINLLLKQACLIAILLLMTTTAHSMQPVQELAPNVYFVEDHSVPLLSLSIIIEGGAATDPAGKAGLARLTMALLDEGAGELDALAFQQALEDKAIRLDFSTSRDIISINLQTLIENKNRAAELLRLALERPLFEKTAIDRVKRQTLSQLAYKEQTPSQQARKLWWETAFEGHPYAHDVEGTPTSIETITDADMRAFLESHLVKDNFHIGLVGDVSAAEAKQWLDDILQNIPASVDDKVTIPKTDLAAPQKVIKPWPGKDAIALFGQQGIDRSDPDYYAAILSNYVLGGGGFDSRLMQEVREKRGLTYGVGTSLVSARAIPLLIGQISSASDSIEEAMEIILLEWRKLSAEGVTAEELQNAKDHEIGSFYLGLDSTAKMADTLAAMQYHDLPASYMEDREDLIGAVSLEKINQLAATILDPDKLIISIIGAPE